MKIYFFLMILMCQIQFAQVKSLYQNDKILSNENKFYTSGFKYNDNKLKKNSKDSFEYSTNYQIAAFKISGENIWEKVFLKEREYKRSSSLFIKGGFLYSVYQVSNRKSGFISYQTLYLVKLDTTGNIIKEVVLCDTSGYGLDKVFFTENFFYVTFYNKKELVCQKIDYNFNLLAEHSNDIITQFFYESDVYETKNNYLAIGPLKELEGISTKIKHRMLGYDFYKPNQQYIKKVRKTISEKSKMVLTPVSDNPENTVSYWCSNNTLFINVRNETSREYSIYRYDEKTTSLKLIIDSLSTEVAMFNYIKPGEYVYITYLVNSHSKDMNKIVKPQTLFYVKNNKVIKTHTFDDLATKKNIGVTFKFTDGGIINIYIQNTINNTFEVKKFSYEKCEYK